jgi:hypothetical protein
MSKSRMLMYEYAEGYHGERERSRFVAFATVNPGKLTNLELEGWCLILETLSMILLQTFDKTQQYNDVPLFRSFYRADMGKSPFLGTNRIPSIRRYGGASSSVALDPVNNTIRGLLAVWRTQGGPSVSRIQKDVKILPPARVPRVTPVVKVGRYQVGLDALYLAEVGYAVGDIITLTLDVVADGHSNPWIDVDPTIFEADEALTLGICISGTDKNPASQNRGQPFARWISRQRNEGMAGITGNPAVNAAMSIIEWLRGEEIVPVPINRVIISDGNRRLDNYYGIAPKPEDQGLKKAHHQALRLSDNGKRALQEFESTKAKRPQQTKRQKLRDELHPAEVVGRLDD